MSHDLLDEVKSLLGDMKMMRQKGEDEKRKMTIRFVQMGLLFDEN